MHVRRLTALTAAAALAATGLAASPTAAAPAPEPAVRTVTAAPAEPAGDRGDLEAFAPPAADGARAADQVLVRFAARTSDGQRRSALGAAGVEGDAAQVPGTGFVAVPTGDDDPAAVAAELRADPRVAEVQVDHVRRATGWTDDPLLEHSAPYVDLLRLPRAWEATTGSGTVVAVLDTGVDGTHPDLAGAVLPGVDLVDDDLDPADPHGHGTLVAGVAAARGDNGVGGVGAAYGARVLPVRVLDANGDGSDSDVAAGITWAVEHDADVVNLSLGGADPSPVLLAAIRAAVAAGVVVVAASGNEGVEAPAYPGAYAPLVDGFVAVSATDDLGAVTTFSNTGDWVSLAAPGLDVVGPAPGNRYVVGTGTSFAAPLVAGGAALVRAHAPGLTPAAVEQRLVATARDAGPKGVDPYYGAGVLDAASAVTAGDARKASVAVPLDRVPGEAPGATNDTVETAEALTRLTERTARLSPEGDVDWYQATAERGWYVVTLRGGGDLDPRLEVRDGYGEVLGRIDGLGDQAQVSVRVPMPTTGSLRIGVSQRNGAASTTPYTVGFAPVDEHRFVPAGSVPGIGGPAIAFADVTADGVEDLVSTFAGGARVHPGLPEGGVGAPTNLAVGAPWSGAAPFAVADLDGDDVGDVVLATLQGLQVFLGGPGGPRPATVVPGGEIPSVVLTDLDGDGDVDIVRHAQGTTQAFLNDGAATFAPGPVLPLAGTPGDVDGDGRVDLVSSTAYSLQRADGTFAAPLALPAVPGTGEVSGVTVADVTGDGRPDVIRTRRSAIAYGAVLVDSWRDGAWRSKAYPVAGTPAAPVAADVEGDGDLDVLAVSTGVHVLLQGDDGLLGSAGYSPLDVPGRQVLGGHVDTDHVLDALVLSDAGVSILRQHLLDNATDGRGWLRGVDLAPHASGVLAGATSTQARRVTFDRPLDPTSVTAGTVRLVDAVSGAVVPTQRRYETVAPDIGTITVWPSQELVAGRHYRLVVEGVRDTTGALPPAPVRSWFTVGAGGDRFTPVDPVRVLDTREPDETGWAAPLAPDERILLGFAGALPADATAVVLSLTAAGPGGQGNVRVFPATDGADTPVPTVSNLNVVRGVDQPNLATVQLAADQSVVLMTEGVTTEVIVDVYGYYTPGGATGYEPTTPTRVLDTRTGTGVRAGLVTGGRWVDLQVAGRNGVPADATAVVLNVVGTQVSGRTFVSAYPTPELREDPPGPTTSSLNLYPGRDQANLVTVKVGEGGQVRFWVDQASAHLVADLAGYYTATGSTGFVPVAPERVADSRSGLGFAGRLQAGRSADLRLAGTGLPVPASARAAVVNVTGVGPAGTTHVRAFPTTVPATLPEVSSINLVRGRDEANLAVLPIGDGGRTTFYSHSAATDLVVDVSGYFRTYR